MVQIDELWPGGPKFTQRDNVFKLGTDAVLLANFPNLTRVKLGADLGCGGGIVSVLLAARSPELRIHCIDIQPQAVELTALNARLNNMSDRITPTLGDIRAIETCYSAGAYDLVVANPPYFPMGSGRAHKNTAIVNARQEGQCTLEDICRAAAYMLRWGGRFAAVHRPERLGELMGLMSSHGMAPKRLRPVAVTAGAPPNLILLEGRRGGNPGLEFEAPLVLRDSSGEDSPEIKAIYHRDER